jgi:alcohol dehydrogenase class IV
VDALWREKFKFRYGGVELYFGPGSLVENIANKLQGVRRALIVTSKSAARVSGALRDVLSALDEVGADYVIYDKVSPNPTTAIADEAARAIVEVGADVVVAIGGGSVIDVAKVASVIAGTGVSSREYVLGKRLGPPSTRLVVVNLTHGTGSEINRFAVLTISGTIEKRGVVARYADVSFDDPTYTLTLSREQSLYTTLDAFYHAYEAATSNRSNLLVSTLAEEVVDIVARYLKRVLEDPGDLEARTMLLYASMLAGVCVDVVGGSHLAHAIEHGLSGLKPELPHGAGLAIVGPYVAYYVHKAAPEKSARILRKLDPSIKPSSEMAEAAMKAIMEFQLSAGFNKRLRDYGIEESDISPVLDFVEKMIRERYAPLLPLMPTREILEDIIRKSI